MMTLRLNTDGRPVWEHLISECPTHMKLKLGAWLNEMGLEGWELVVALSLANNPSYVYVFKRQAEYAYKRLNKRQAEYAYKRLNDSELLAAAGYELPLPPWKHPMPEGYTVIKHEDDSIVVAMDFGHFNRECVKFIEYEGRLYTSGAIEAIPKGVEACSCRTYHLVKDPS